MSIFSEKNGKKVLSSSFYFKILIFIGLICVSVLGMMPLQAALGLGMGNIRDNFIKKLEDFSGLEIHYSSIRPVLLNSFDIRNLRFEKNEEQFITISRIKIKYSILELLLGKKTFIHTVIIESPVLEIDAQKDKDTFEILSSLFKKEKNGSSQTGTDAVSLSDFLPYDADYQIQNGYFFLIDNGTEYQIENMHMFIKENNKQIVLNGSFTAVYKYASPFEKNYIVRTDVNMKGLCANDFLTGNADVAFLNFTCSQQDAVRKNTSFFKPPQASIEKPKMLFSVNPFKIKLTLEDDLLCAFGNDENAPNNYLLQLDTKTGVVFSEIKFAGFKMAEHVVFHNYPEEFKPLLSFQLDGSASFRYENKDSFVYNANIKSGDTAKAKNNPLTDAFLLSAYGDEKTVHVKEFLASSSSAAEKSKLFRGKMDFSGEVNFDTFKINGDLGFDHFSLSGNNSLSAQFDISTIKKEIQILSDTILISQTQIDDFSLFMYPAEKDIAIAFSCFASDGGEIIMDALYNKKQKQLEASLSLRTLSIYEITEYISPFSGIVSSASFMNKGNLKNSYIDTDIFMQTDFNNIIYNAPNIVLTFGESSGKFAVSGTDKRLTLSEGLIYFDKDNELFISSNVNFSNPMDLFFDLKAGFKDLSWNVEGQVLDRSTLIVRDPNGLNIYGNSSNTGELSGYIEGKDYPFLVNTQTVYLNFYSTLRYTSVNFWNLDINRFTVRNISTGSSEEIIRISGSADQDGANFKEIVYTDSVGTLSGGADFSWDSKFSYIEFLVNISDGRDAGEYYYLDGIVKDDHVKLKASVSELHLNRFYKNSNPLLVSADMDITWDSIESFNADIDVKSLRTRIDNDVILASVGVNLNNDELLVRNLRLDFGGIKGILPEFKLSRTEGIAKAKAQISGIALQKVLESRIDIDFNFMQVNSWFEIAQVIEEFNGTILLANVQYGDLKQDSIAFNFNGSKGALSVYGGIRNMLRLEMESDGTFYAGLSSPFPIQGTVIGTYNKGNINAACSNFFLDLSSLYSLVGKPDDFNILGGHVTGSMEFVGPVLNPEMNGSGVGSSMRCSVPGYISEDICLVPFSVIAQGYEMTFGPVTAAVGNGGSEISGWFLFENWAPVEIGLDINIPMQTPVPYNFNITGFLAEGNASGNLLINVNINETFIDIKGNIFTNDADLGMNMEELSSGQENGNSKFNTNVDMKITTGSMVEFVWPLNNPIIRANPVMGTVIYITSDTEAGQFSLNSDVKLRSGEIFYVNRNFFIRHGNIVFKETESSFNPIFSARADIRDRVDAGPVVISMIVNNQPLLDFIPRFESNPSISQLEIYSILGQNFGVAQGEDNSEQAQRFLLSSTADVLTHLIGTSDVLSQFVFFRQFERQVRDTVGFDMFSVRTRFIQNLAVTGVSGALNTSRQGQPNVDRDVRSGSLGNYFDNTSVFIGKYIGQHMFISYMGTLKYDENSDVLGGVRFEQDIGIELDSPFVNIRWDFFPNNPQNWWVTDHSITLSWSMSF